MYVFLVSSVYNLVIETAPGLQAKPFFLNPFFVKVANLFPTIIHPQALSPYIGAEKQFGVFRISRVYC